MSEDRNEYGGILMTEDQKKAYDDFIDFMAQLYRDYSYLLEGKQGQS
ncbi:MAG: hypothetical protein Q4C20_10065 [Erysipelotrichaceae bacterium]|nr:hypothetical protein [Erysipelotrichaceae bacterium]